MLSFTDFSIIAIIHCRNINIYFILKKEVGIFLGKNFSFTDFVLILFTLYAESVR